MSKVKFSITGNGIVHRRASDILKSADVRGRVTKPNSDQIQQKRAGYTSVSVHFTADEQGSHKASTATVAKKSDAEFAAG